MVTIVNGSALGLQSSLPGTRSNVGSNVQGQNPDGVYVNSATGNLVVQDQDELLSAIGSGLSVVRTYNSLGNFDDPSGNNWRLSAGQRVLGLTGTVNTAGSTIVKEFGDGSQITYTYNASLGLYIAALGTGADDTLSYNSFSVVWTWTNGATRATEQYNSAGQMTSSADSSNNVTHYTYNTAGLLTQITDPSGQTTILDYSGNNLIDITEVSNGLTQKRIQYSYDSSNRLTTVTIDLTPANNSPSDPKYVTTYTYQGTTDLLASITQSDGTAVSFQYVNNRIWKVTDGDGNVTQFSYPAASTTTVTDALGNITTYTLDTTGRLTSIATPLTQTNYTYDTNGNLQTVTQDPSGLNAATTYTYDSNGNLLSSKDAAGETITYTYNADNQLLTKSQYVVPASDSTAASSPITTRYVYDSKDRLRFVISAIGDVTEYRYNAVGQRSNQLVYGGADLYNITGLSASTAPTLAQMTSWAAALSATQNQSIERTDYTYDFRGNLSTATLYSATSTSGAGAGTVSTTQYVYDQRGQLLQVIDPRGIGTAPNATNPNPNQAYATTYTYDGLGRVQNKTQWVSTVQGVTNTVLTSYGYTASTDTIQTTFANGLVTTRVYDKAGHLLSVANSDLAAHALGTTTYQYDADGRLAIRTDPTGNKQYLIYDANGRKVGEVDVSGDVNGAASLTQYIYDNANELVKTVRYADYLSAATVASLTNASGQPVSVSIATLVAALPTTVGRASDQITRSVYDLAWRKVYDIDAAGDVTQYFYDGAGRVTSQIQYANPVSIAASVNALTPSQVGVAASAGNDRQTSYFYDNDGRLVGELDPRGYLTQSIYDAAGQLSEKIAYAVAAPAASYSGGQWSNLPAANFAQDEVSAYFYDAEGNLVGAFASAGANAAGTAYSGYFTQTQYDTTNNNNITTNNNRNIAASTQYAQQITYTAGTSTGASMLAAAQAAAAVQGATAPHVTSYQFDGSNQLVQETNFEGTVTNYVYDNAGHLISQTVAVGSTIPNDTRTTQIKYDALGRVTAQLSAAGSALLTGNLTQTQINTIWAQYGTAYTYDTAGRRTSQTVTAYNPTTGTTQTETTQYFYNEAGQLRFTMNALGEVTENQYNALGQVSAQVNYYNRVSNPTALTGGLLTSAALTVLAGIANAAKDKKTSYTYKLNDKVATRTTAEGGSVTYGYDAFGEVNTSTTVVDASRGVNLIQNFTYDRDGDLFTAQADSSGVNQTLTYAYDAFDRQISVTDQYGNKTSTQYDSLGRVIATIDAATNATNGSTGTATTTKATYDAFSRVLTTTDAFGNTTQHNYVDAARNVTVTTPEGVSVTTVHNRNGQTLTVTTATNTTSYTYNLDGEVTGISDNLGTLESRQYDSAGRQVTDTDANGVVTAFTYDAANRLFTRTVDPTGLNLMTSYAYDGEGRVMSTTGANGVVTTTQYDRDGRVYQVAIDPTGLNLVTQYNYDNEGDVVTLTQALGSSNPRVTQYTYDALGRRTKEVVDPGAGNNPATGQPYLNLTTQYFYDANSNLIHKIDPTGNSTWYVYDADNRVHYTVNALGGITETDYDGNGRVSATRQYVTAMTPPAATVHQVTVTPVTSSADRLARHYFGADGHEVYTIGAAGTVTQRTYDTNGKVIQLRVISGVALTGTYTTTAAVTTALGTAATTLGTADRVQWTVYDARGRAIVNIDALGNVTWTQYDGDGNVVASTSYATPITPPATLVTSLSATVPAGGPPQIIVNGNTNSPITVASSRYDRLTRYWYDTTGRQVFTLNPAGYLTRTQYNDAARTQTVTMYVTPQTIPGDATTSQLQNGGVVIATSAGTTVSTPTGTVVVGADQTTRTLFDAAGRVSQVTDALGNSESFSYDANDNLTHKVDANGNSTWYVYDAADRVHYTINALGGITQTDYDSDGRVSVTRQYATATTPPAGTVNQLTLSQVTPVASSADRLTRHYYDADGNEVYTIDAAGTVTQRTPDTYGEIIQLRVISRVALTGTYTTTAAVTAALGAAATTLGTADRVQWTVYDVRGRAILNIDALGNVTQTQYDGLGNLVSSTAYATPITPPTTWVTSLSANVPASGPPQIIVNGNANSPITVASSSSDRKTRYWYDTIGRRVFTLSPTGYLTQTQYNDATHTETVTVYATAQTIPTNATTSQLQNGGVVIATSAGTTVSTPTGSVVVGADQTTKTFFDAAGRVSQVTDALGKSESYTYDAVGNKLTYTNKNQQTWTYKYDGDDRLIEEDSPYVSVSNVAANAGALTATPVTASIVALMSYDALGNVKTLTEGIERQSNGTQITANSRLTSYGYDALGRQTSVTLPSVPVYNGISSDAVVTQSGTAIGSNSTLQAPTTQVVYDTLGNEIASRDAGNNWTYKVYDQLGRVVYQIDALNFVTGYTYDEFGNQRTTTRYNTPLSTTATGGTSASIAGGTLFALQAANTNSAGATITVTNSNGANRVTSLVYVVAASGQDRTITTNYDLDNRVSQVSQPQVFSFQVITNESGGQQPTFTAAPTIQYTYDAFGQVVRTAALINPTGTAPSWAYSFAYYDQVGNKTADINADGYLTTYQYDAEGNIIGQYEYAQALSINGATSTNTPPPQTQAPNDRQTQYQYDQLNRKVTQTLVGVQYLSGSGVATGNAATSYGYDALGNQTAVSVNGATTYTYYDVLGRVVATVGPAPGDSSSVTPLALMQRDVYGNLVTQTQYAAGLTSTSGNAAPTTANTSPDVNKDRTTLYLRDVEGHALETEQFLTSLNSGEGNPINNTRTYDAYDARGKLVKQYQPANPSDTLVTFYTYDALGQETDVISPELAGSASQVSDQFTDYDAFGEVKGKGVVAYGAQKVDAEFFYYDQAGRVFLTNASGVYNAYLYDLAGNATGMFQEQTGAPGFNLSTNLIAQSSAASAYAAYTPTNTDGLLFTQTRYDAMGNVLETRLPVYSSPNPIESMSNTGVLVQPINGTTCLTWYAPADSTLTVTLFIDGVQQNYQHVPNSDGTGNEYGYQAEYALSGLAPGQHTYLIQYTRPTLDVTTGTPLVAGEVTGTFNVGESLTPIVANNPGMVGSVSVALSGSSLLVSWVPDNTAVAPTFSLLVGGNWQSVTGSISEGGIASASLTAPSPGTYQYRITDTLTGATEAQGTGTISISGSTTTTSLGASAGTAGTVTGISAAVIGSTATVAWHADSSSVTSSSFQILIGGTWTSYTPALSESGIYNVSFPLPSAGTYQYAIADQIQGMTEAQAAGSISFTAPTSGLSVINGTAATGTVNNVTSVVTGSTVSVSWTPDVGGTSNSSFSILIGGTWTPYVGTLSESGVYTASFALPAAGTYQYRITDLINGVTEAQGAGSISFTAVGSSTSLTNSTAATGTVNSVSSSVIGSTVSVSWTADVGGTANSSFAILIGGTWTSYTPSLSESGVYFVSFPLPAAGTYQYRITDLVNSVTEAQGTGSISFTAATSSLSLLNGTAATGTVNSVTSVVSGSTVSVSWTPDVGGTANSSFAILIGGTWTSFTGTLSESGVYTASFALPAAGTYQYRITDLINGVTEAQGTGSISFTAASSSTSTTGSSTPSAVWYTPSPVTASAGVSAQGSGSVVSSALPAQSPIRGENGQITGFTDFWNGTNAVSLNWLSLASGTYTLNIFYNTLASSNFGIASVAAVKSFALSGGSFGQFSWNDPSQQNSFAPGGISSLSYFQIVQNGTVVRDSRSPGLTTTTISWAAPADTSYVGALFYRLAGTSSYTQVVGFRSGNTFQAFLSALTPGTYDYIAEDYQLAGESPINLSQVSGQFVATASSTSISSQNGTPGYLSGVAVSGSSLTWAQAMQAGDSLQVQIVSGGTAYTLSPSSSDGTNYSASFYSYPSGTYSYTISYIHGGSTYLQGTGTLSINTTTTNTPATSSIGTPTQLGAVTGFADLGNGVFGWNTASNSGDAIVFHYKAAGAPTWASTLAVSGSSPSYSVNLSGLSGSLDYEVDYIASGAAQPYKVGRGTVTVQTTTTPATSSIGTPTQLAAVTGFADRGNGVFGWNAASNAGDTIVFHYKASGASAWTNTLAVSGSSPSYSVNLSGLSGSLDYEVDYIASGAAQPYKVGRGTVTVQTTTTPATSSIGTPTQLAAVTGFADRGNGVLGWNTASNSGDTIVFHYKAAGASSWAGTLSVSGSSPSYSVNLSALSGSIDYEVDYTASGAAQPYKVGRGSATIQTVTTPATATLGTPTQLLAVSAVADQGNGILGWNTASNSGDTIVFHYKAAGASSWAGTLSVSGSSPSYSVNLSSLSGTISYEIDYLASGSTQPYRVGWGSVTITRTTNPGTASASAPVNLSAISGFQDLGNGHLGWTTAANSGDTIQFHYKSPGASSWTGTLPVSGTGPYSVDLSGFSGTIAYEIDYISSGAAQPYRVETGTVTINKGFSVAQDTTSSSLQPTAAAPDEQQTVDRWGNILSSTNTAQQTTTYTYNRYNELLTTTDPSVKVVSVAMAANGTGTASPPQSATPVSYNYYDLYGRLIETQDADGNINTRSYNLENQLTSQQDADGGQISYLYDAFGDQIQVTTNVDAQTRYKTLNAYDQAGRLTDTEQELLSNIFTSAMVTGFASSLLPASNLNVIRTQYQYDQAGRRVATVDGAGGVTRTGYDLHGNVISTTTALNATTSYGYDLQDRETSETDPNGNHQSWNYDYFNRLLNHTDFGGTLNTYTYDTVGSGLLTLMTSTGGQFAPAHQSYSYDSANHLVQISDTGVNSTTNYYYDAAGRIERQLTNDGGLLAEDTSTQYDAMGRIANISGLGYSVSYSYDAAGNRTNINAWYTVKTGSTSQQNYWYGYDKMNRVVISEGVNTNGSITENANQGTILTYDWRGDRTSATTQATNFPTETIVNEAGTNHAVYGTATGQAYYVYAYDGAGRLTDTTVRPLANPAAPAPVIDARHYDQASRITQETTLTVTNGTPYFDQQTNTYNADGTLSSTTTTRNSKLATVVSYAHVVNESGQLVNGYDAAGNLVGFQVSNYDPNNIDANGNSRFLYNSQNAFTYALGNTYLKSEQTVVNQGIAGTPGNGRTDYSYNADQQLIQFSDANTSANNRAFLNNANGQVLTVALGTDGGYGITGSNKTTYGSDPEASAQFGGALMAGNAFFQANNAQYFFYDSNGRSVGTFGELNNKLTANFDVNFTPISQQYPAQEPPQYVVQTGDSLASVAARVYGDASLWYIIAQANGLTGEGPGDAPSPGTALTLPNVVVALPNSAQSFKPFSISQALGDTTPYQPPPPPPQSHGGCGVLGSIFAAIVTAVATYFSWGILTTAVAAAFADALGQEADIALGNQSSFNWTQVAETGIGSAVSAGLASEAGQAAEASIGISNPIAQTAVNAAIGNAVSQGVAIGFGDQKGFNWTAVAASAAAAPIARYVGKGVGDWTGQQLGTSLAAREISSFVSQVTAGEINSIAVAAFSGGKIDYVQAAADAFGNVIGDSFMQAVFGPPPAKAPVSGGSRSGNQSGQAGQGQGGSNTTASAVATASGSTPTATTNALTSNPNLESLTAAAPAEASDQASGFTVVLPGEGSGGQKPLKIYDYNAQGQPIYDAGTGTTIVGEMTKTSDQSGLYFNPAQWPAGAGEPQAYVDDADNKAWGYSKNGVLAFIRMAEPRTALGEALATPEGAELASVALTLTRTTAAGETALTPVGWVVIGGTAIWASYELLSGNDNEMPTVTVTADRKSGVNSTIPDDSLDSAPLIFPVHQEPSDPLVLPIADQGPTFTPLPSHPPSDLGSPPPLPIPDHSELDRPYITPIPPSDLLPSSMASQGREPGNGAAANIPQGVLDNQVAQDHLLANQQQQLKDAIDQGGARARGAVFDSQGKAVQNITTDTLRQIPNVQVNTNVTIAEGEGGQIDNVVTNGDQSAYVESKLTLRDINQRTINQLTNAVNQSEGGDMVVLQVARAPTTSELTSLRQGLGQDVYSQIRVVSKQTELYDLVRKFFSGR